jgi:hypothetical protein
MASFQTGRKINYLLLCAIGLTAMLVSCVKTPVTQVTSVSDREHISQRAGAATISRFDSRIFLTEGDELELLKSSTAGNTLFVVNTNNEIRVEHKEVIVKLLRNDVV